MFFAIIRKYYLKLPPNLKKIARKIYDIYLDILLFSRWFLKNIKGKRNFNRSKDSVFDNLNQYEWRRYSQNGEDGMFEAIFHKIGTTNKFCVEFGVGDGRECNTRYLIEKKGWDFLHMDADSEIPKKIKKEFITPENINKLFKKYDVPKRFDLLSIDIDSFDYWVWKEITDYVPRVVVIEFNSGMGTQKSSVLNPDPKILEEYPDASRGGGSSLKALYKLGMEKGYTLLATDSRGINAFFVKNEDVNGKFYARDLGDIHNPPKYSKKIKGVYHGYPIPKEASVDV